MNWATEVDERGTGRRERDREGGREGERARERGRERERKKERDSWLTPKKRASVSQGRICSEKNLCCHTEIEVVDQTVYLTQSPYTDTEPTSPSADPVVLGA